MCCPTAGLHPVPGMRCAPLSLPPSGSREHVRRLWVCCSARVWDAVHVPVQRCQAWRHLLGWVPSGRTQVVMEMKRGWGAGRWGGAEGLRPCVESVPEPEVSSPVLTWILGYIWSLPRGVSPRLEWGHARALSSRAVAAVARFPSSGSRDLWLSLEAFPRGFPTSLSHRAVPRANVV